MGRWRVEKCEGFRAINGMTNSCVLGFLNVLISLMGKSTLQLSEVLTLSSVTVQFIANILRSRYFTCSVIANILNLQNINYLRYLYFRLTL